MRLCLPSSLEALRAWPPSQQLRLGQTGGSSLRCGASFPEEERFGGHSWERRLHPNPDKAREGFYGVQRQLGIKEEAIGLYFKWVPSDMWLLHCC